MENYVNVAELAARTETAAVEVVVESIYLWLADGVGEPFSEIADAEVVDAKTGTFAVGATKVLLTGLDGRKFEITVKQVAGPQR